MPTAEAFELAKSRFLDGAEESRRVPRPIRSATGTDVLSGGKLAASVNELIEDVDQRLRVIATELEALADTAGERAELTRQAAAAAEAHSSATAAFEADDQQWAAATAASAIDPTAPNPGPRPVPPVPPTIPPFADI